MSQTLIKEVKNVIAQCDQVLGSLTPEEFNTLFSTEEIEFLKRLKRLSEVQHVGSSVAIKIQCLQKQLKIKA